MSSERGLRLILVGVIVLSVAGAVDAVVGAVWDQLAILTLVAGLCIAALAQLRSSRPSLTVRKDLARWLRARAAVEGEPVDAVTDRALAAYRQSYETDRVDDR